MPLCPHCDKEYKNLKLHIRKIHDDIAIKSMGHHILKNGEKGRIIGYEVYKNGIKIDTLDYCWADSHYTSTKKNDEGDVLILYDNNNDVNNSQPKYRLYYGHKKAGVIGEGYNGETVGNLYCNKFRKIDW